MDYFLIIARMLHVISVVIWIGGVSFVTTVLIPSLKKMDEKDKRLKLFEILEGRFSGQAKIVTLLAGISGFYMVHGLNAWHRYLDLSYWWIHMMTAIWLIFTLVLFVLEPLFLHKTFHKLAANDSDRAIRLLFRFHIILLSLSLIAILGAVAGVRGLTFH